MRQQGRALRLPVWRRNWRGRKRKRGDLMCQSGCWQETETNSKDQVRRVDAGTVHSAVGRVARFLELSTVDLWEG